MGKTSEGVRRLSLVAGPIPLALWFLISVISVYSEIESITRDNREFKEANQELKEARRSAKITEKKRQRGSSIALSDEEYLYIEKSLAQDRVERGKIVSFSMWMNDNFGYVMGFALAGGVSFFFPWGAVRTIAWIVNGFRQGSGASP